ncbi:MAG: alpha-amylase family glycosyl hydrolase, partial [bacterium]
KTVKAGHLNAMGLIDEILHYVVALYRQQLNPDVMAKALNWLQSNFGKEEVEKTIIKFTEEFPPVDVYKNKLDIRTYLSGSTKGVSNRQVALEEMLLLWLANLNPAFSPYLELFDDRHLKKETAYSAVMQSLGEFFETQPPFGPENQNLIELLRTPAIRNPHSLEAQLLFMREHWGMLIGEFLSRLLKGLGFIKEEAKAIFWGPPPTLVPEYLGLEEEPERFSPDLDWMPNLVLIAKSTLVWLDQLSKKYQRAIHRLDQIPDEELDRLASWGFTGLWLIGVWERSPASKKIKQMCGNPEAESSAYSLFDYEIAQEIGGYEALQNLRDRCWRRGIRLASDMVPNHTGIDSKWVREHPDWFISLSHSPFPSYSFNSENLSQDPRYGIFIEDKYFNRTDAAVVFKREDYWTGDVRFIYHGNDGTHMPWNDTAQLNFLNPEVREAVIQKIINVARMFPIIRFDAAMTLAKKHYQRLWFPEPGSGGDIPSRAEYGLTKTEFHHQMSQEFWREVVDRVAQEVPDTLLLAEAFWLMEGYFVRSLGMHRVYNSAFMNMLKNEENEKYRNTIKNTIQFNPEILKRYVNFMNNPDEETAIAQFGDGDKYFGVCLMMVTMPGLPMFGHGQIEGWHEKYGMEYRRAYWDEPVNWGLVERHERAIFPLMKKRYLFAQVENFLLYDFFTPQGRVNENVFAYSNRCGEERTLVVYNNKFEQARGWIRTSTAYAVKTGNGHETQLVQKSLGEGLALINQENYF